MRRFIFFWFLAVGIISLIGAAWIGRSMKLTATGFYESDVADDAAETVVRDAAEAVAHALDHGGVSTLHDLERRLDPKRKLRFFVFDPDLHEVAGGPAPESIRAFAGSLRSVGNTQLETSGGELAGSIVTVQDGCAYRVIVRVPAYMVAKAPVQAWSWSGRIAAIVAAAGLLCIWVAWRLSAPLARLSRATSLFASGDLTARAGAAAFPSRPPEYKKLAHDFDDMAGRIERLVDSQRQLLRDVSHELRTPLTRLSLAVDNARHAPESSVAASLDRIDQESERLNALIDRIIRLSRCEAFAEPPHRDIIECADFIESLVSDADFEATAHTRRVSLLPPQPCRLARTPEL